MPLLITFSLGEPGVGFQGGGAPHAPARPLRARLRAPTPPPRRQHAEGPHPHRDVAVVMHGGMAESQRVSNRRQLVTSGSSGGAAAAAVLASMVADHEEDAGQEDWEEDDKKYA